MLKARVQVRFRGYAGTYVKMIVYIWLSESYVRQPHSHEALTQVLHLLEVVVVDVRVPRMNEWLHIDTSIGFFVIIIDIIIIFVIMIQNVYYY